MEYYNAPKSQFGSWVANFLAVCESHASELRLAPEDVAEIASALERFNSSWMRQLALDNAARGATDQADDDHVDAKVVVAKYSRQFQAIPGLPAELIAELGLKVRQKRRTRLPIYVPADLSAEGRSNGVNLLKWSGNGNHRWTTYIVEAAFDGGSSWQFVGATTRQRYAHANQQPGRFVRYRVHAQRGTTCSHPSGEACVYDPAPRLDLDLQGRAA